MTTTAGKQISITKTEGEWLLIEKKLQVNYPPKKDNPKDRKVAELLAMHIRKEIAKIKLKYNCDPTEFVEFGGTKIERRPFIPHSVMSDIKEIASTMNVKEATVIEMFVITPLLQK